LKSYNAKIILSFLLGLLLLSLVITVFVTSYGQLFWIHALIGSENSISENLTVLFYLFCAFMSFSLRKEVSNRLELISVIFLTVYFFFTAMEEVNFGQALFFQKTKVLTNINNQNALNFHNLTIFHEYKPILRVIYFYAPFLFIIGLYKKINIQKHLLALMLPLLLFPLVNFLNVSFDSVHLWSFHFFDDEFEELLFATLFFVIFAHNIPRWKQICILTPMILLSAVIHRYYVPTIFKARYLNSIILSRFIESKDILEIYNFQKKYAKGNALNALRVLSLNNNSNVLNDIKPEIDKLKDKYSLKNNLLLATYYYLVGNHKDFIETNNRLLKSTLLNTKPRPIRHLVYAIASHNLGNIKRCRDELKMFQESIDETNISSEEKKLLLIINRHLHTLDNIKAGELILYLNSPFKVFFNNG